MLQYIHIHPKQCLFFNNLYNHYNITPLQTASDKGHQHPKKCKDNLFDNQKTEITLFTLGDSFVLRTVYSALD
jgi:hypothetical protein